MKKKIFIFLIWFSGAIVAFRGNLNFFDYERKKFPSIAHPLNVEEFTICIVLAFPSWLDVVAVYGWVEWDKISKKPI